MAIDCRKNLDDFLYAMAASYNKMRQHLATLSGTAYHADVTSSTSGDFTAPVVTYMTATVANATDLATAVALGNELKAKFNIHCADTLAHKAADTVNPVTAANAGAADQTACNTLLNQIKANFNTHLSQAGVHYHNDAANSVATADSTDPASAAALANALKTAFNAHILSAFGGYAINLVNP